MTVKHRISTLLCATAMSVALGSWALSPAAFAQSGTPSTGNLDKLQDFKTTGASMEMETVPQTGPKAEALKKTLAGIKLPDGFKISLYAIVPDAREIGRASCRERV